jgi:hypothetical protein
MSESVLIQESPTPGREYPARAGVTLGREGCDVVLTDPEVSRRHAALRESESGIAIEDLGSTNGTFVNESRITGMVALSDGDTIRLGDTVLRLRVAAAATRLGAQPAAQEPAPAAPAEPAPAAPADGRRGDVPRPSASAIMPAVPLPPPESAPAFATEGGRRPVRGSAARRMGVTIYAFAVVLIDFIALAIYFAAR